MSVLSSGVRIGAAAFAVGLSLAGPQVVGVAVADSASTDAGPVSAGTADPGIGGGQVAAKRSQVRRSSRSAMPSAGIPGAEALRAVRAPASAGVKRSVWAAGSVQSGQMPSSGAAVRMSVISGRGFAAASAPVAKTFVSAVPSTSQGEVTDSTPAVFATVPDHVQYLVESFSGQIMDALHNFYGSASNWLATLPEGPVTDFLSGALLLVRRTLLPSGYDSSVGLYRPPTEIAPDFNTVGCKEHRGDCPYDWYDVQNTARNIRLGPVLEGTDGAVIRGGNIFNNKDPVFWATVDGCQGMITNMTGKPIVVQADRQGAYDSEGESRDATTAMAILFPGEWMPYQIDESTLTFYPIDLTAYDPATLPSPPNQGVARVYLLDPHDGTPSLQFSANGVGDGVYYRFDEGGVVNFGGDAGNIEVRVRRQHDGWSILPSSAYLHRYENPNNWGTSDWAIFNIDIKKL